MKYIGIDTGVHTGVAVWNNRQRTFEQIECMKIHQALELVTKQADICQMNCTRLVVRVEDARQRKWFGTERMSREVERKRLQGVGSVKRDAVVWEDFLTDLTAHYRGTVEFQMVAPKNNMTKITAESFKDLTHWKKRTNEHERDAAMLVYGF